MIAHQIFAYIWNETVQNVVVCDNYTVANDIAKGSYGNTAFAVECTQYPCQIGDKYINGIFYKKNTEIEVEYIPTQEQEVSILKAQNALLVTATSFIANTFTDEQALQVTELYPLWNGNGINYHIGNRVIDENYILYKVITDHISQESWKPSVSPSLFSVVLSENPNQIVDWVQPDSTNGYSKNTLVRHKGKEWESLVDDNVWEPGIVGTESLWKEIIK